MATEPGLGYGLFMVRKLRCIAHNGILVDGEDPELGGWEHVSVSRAGKVPSWHDMDEIKMLFWDAEDPVMQLHPPRSQWVNCHPYTLHLWRPLQHAIPLPPHRLVGPSITG